MESNSTYRQVYLVWHFAERVPLEMGYVLSLGCEYFVYLGYVLLICVAERAEQTRFDLTVYVPIFVLMAKRQNLIVTVHENSSSAGSEVHFWPQEVSVCV